MLLNIYKAHYPADMKKRLFLAIPTGQSLDQIPEDVHRVTGELSLHHKIEIKKGERHDLLDVEHTLQDIELKGFHLFEIDTDLPEREWRW